MSAKTVLITGGSSGIGYEMSKHFAADGYQLLWVSHDQEELDISKARLREEFPNVSVETFCQDLTEDIGAERVYQWSCSKNNPNVIINNAGFGTYGYVNEINQSSEIKMIQLNIVALYKLTRLFLKDMIQEDSGTIINICSNSAFQPIPRMTTYAATKGFVYQFSRALQEEMDITGSNVRVITVCPAAISDTPFRDQLAKNVKTFDGLVATTAQEVARDVWRGFEGQKTFIISGRKMRWLYRIRGLIPAALQRKLVRQETEAV